MTRRSYRPVIKWVTFTGADGKPCRQMLKVRVFRPAYTPPDTRMVFPQGSSCGRHVYFTEGLGGNIPMAIEARGMSVFIPK